LCRCRIASEGGRHAPIFSFQSPGEAVHPARSAHPGVGHGPDPGRPLFVGGVLGLVAVVWPADLAERLLPPREDVPGARRLVQNHLLLTLLLNL